MAATQCCVPNCNKTRTDNVILHVFPKPDRESERFDFWLEATDGELSHLTRNFIFKNRRICHLHFEKKYFTRSRRLASNAIPTLNLPGFTRNSHLVSRTLQINPPSENKDVDDPLLEFLPEDDVDISMKTANANTHINTIHKEKCTPFEIDKSSNGNSVNRKDTLTCQQDKELREENKSTFWKIKLVYILHNTQFCGICLDGDVDMNALTDVFEIVDDEKTYRRSLRDIVDKVFKKTGRMASSKICNNCTKKLIQSYIFIHTAEEKSEMLNYYLTELFSKTCYIRKNILKDSNIGKSKIHNAVIALDNKDISENMDHSKLIIEDQPDRNQPDFKRHQRILKCVSCNMILPSYRAWKTHDRLAHKQSHRCRICLQTYKTQQALITHCRTHFKSYGVFYRTSYNNRRISESGKVTKNVYECQCKKRLCSLVLLHQHKKSCGLYERKYQHNNYSINPNSSKCETKPRKFKYGANMFPCGLCDRVFLNELKRGKHILQAHSRRKKKIATSLECLVCQAKFVSKAALVLHQKYHKPVTKYSCKVCKVQFDNSREFKAHNRKHALSFSMCEVCGKRMDKLTIKKHLSTHSDIHVLNIITQVH